MRLFYYLLIIIVSFTTLFCKGKPQRDIVLLTVRNDRFELAKAVEFLNTKNPGLICVNVDLFRCDQERPRDLSPNHEDQIDSLAVRSVTYPSEAEKKLSRELNATNSLLMPSMISPFGEQGYAEIIGCGFLYSDEVSSGFINLVNDEDIASEVEKFQLSLIDPFNNVSYHFAMKIAFVLNTEKAQSFIVDHDDTVSIDFSKERNFATYNFDDFVAGKVSGEIFNSKVVIIGVGEAADYFLVGNSGELQKMSSSEIFANIACQVIGE